VSQCDIRGALEQPRALHECALTLMYAAKIEGCLDHAVDVTQVLSDLSRAFKLTTGCCGIPKLLMDDAEVIQDQSIEGG
jgi:hypothetical protein